ncbi:LytR/AlgR family response regulator transcription factor [Pedobacter lithocola]|uniref:LytR/AlgR family response regulator transcription factor n=1 Tax=Pedobacter lithocola TaxID=1908239 RepID=A0ABV8P722_9SPHI
MPINCIAIDDDLNSLENLKFYLKGLPDLQLVKSFTNPVKALNEITDIESVDIIFMDIEMPALSGIELAAMVRQKTKHLIFTTAHTKYAIDAFGVNADAYLLKPYSMVHFTETISKLYPNDSLNAHEIEDEFFLIPIKDTPDDFVKIEFIDLVAFEEINDIVYFRTIKKNYVSFKLNFVKVLSMLKRHPAFIQVNSSAIISKLHIKSFLGNQIVLTGGLSIPLTNKYNEAFILYLKENLFQDNLINDN